MILIKRKPRNNYDAIGYIDNINVEIWEGDVWKGGMNTSYGEAAITANGQAYFIKKLRHKWYQRKKIEIHNDKNERVGNIRIEGSKKAYLTIGSNVVAIYNEQYVKQTKWVKRYDYYIFNLQIDKNAITEIELQLKLTETKKNIIFGSIPRLKQNIDCELPANTLSTLELLSIWYAVEYFRGYMISANQSRF